jgi:lipopolysaccharide export system protein LptA
VARWQRHARFALAIFAIGFAIFLWFNVGERLVPAPVPSIDRLDPKAASEIRGGDVLQHKGTTRDIRVEFGSQILYTDGKTKFTSFKAFIDDRGGRSFVLSGHEAYVGTELSSYDVRGKVVLETSDGLTVATNEATFVEAEGIVRGPGPVEFKRGRVTGSGVGFTYDRSLDRLWLLDRAAIQVAPAAEGGGMQVTAGAAGHSRAERYMRLERGARIERSGQVMQADNATIFLASGRDEPENVELRGGSSITGGTGTSALSEMQARDINLQYGADGRTLEQTLLMGQGRIQLARADGTPGQELKADTIDASLAPDGALTRLVGRDQVQMTIPAGPQTAARTVIAPLLNASGQAERGLTSMTFENGVEYREEASKEGPRVARARTLKAALASSDAIDVAEFLGGFRFEEGRTSATSADALYNVAKGTLALKSAPGTAAHLQDQRVIIDANAIDLTLAPRVLNASGKVSAQFAAGRREGDRGTTLFSEKEGILGTAEKFTFDETSGTGAYTGEAALWQAESGTSVRAQSIELNNKTGTLTARTGVVATLPVAAQQKEGKAATSLGRADEFDFNDAKRTIVFSKQAQLDGAQGNVHANRIELFLAARGNELDRLEARDNVKVVLEKREATGQRLTYHPGEEKYVLSGAPVRLVQECQESTGRALTFWRSSDRIQVDGNEVRAQTKGGKCP